MLDEELAYNELVKRSTKKTETIEESDEEYECYKLTDFPTVAKIVMAKYPTANFVHVELLKNSDENTEVFNLMFFDDEEEIIAGCELTPAKVHWDDFVEST